MVACKSKKTLPFFAYFITYAKKSQLSLHCGHSNLVAGLFPGFGNDSGLRAVFN